MSDMRAVSRAEAQWHLTPGIRGRDAAHELTWIPRVLSGHLWLVRPDGRARVRTRDDKSIRLEVRAIGGATPRLGWYPVQTLADTVEEAARVSLFEAPLCGHAAQGAVFWLRDPRTGYRMEAAE